MREMKMEGDIFLMNIYLHDQLNERRQKFNQMLSDNKCKDNMTISKDKQFINNQPYSTNVSVPTVEDINQLTDTELNRIQAVLMT